MDSQCTRMGEKPSLFSLCMKAITSAIIYGDRHLDDVFELPSDLFDTLLEHLPPLALQKLHELSCNFRSRECHIKHDFITHYTMDVRKRARFDASITSCCEKMPRSRNISYLGEELTCGNSNFNKAWKALFDLRWPESGNQTQSIDSVITQVGDERSKVTVCGKNWQILYWEAHLQNCLDEAAAKALLPSFQGCIGEITMPDTIMRAIGYKRSKSDTTWAVLKLSYHCEQFSCYASYLRLQNVLCVVETCELLRNSRLQGIAFRGIKSKTHVEGACKLLNQNCNTLFSLEFIYCRLLPTALNDICDSLYEKRNPEHGIQYFSIKSSSMFMSRVSPTRFLSFLSSGRSLCSLQICDSELGQELAKMIFDSLLDSLSGLSSLELSDNKISGWFSKYNGGLSDSFTSSLGVCKSLKALSILNLRGNNLSKDDAGGLKFAMLHMPHLQCLDISDNPIGDDGIRILTSYFIEASKISLCLAEIKIENCDLSCLGVAQLLESFSSLSEPLRSLSIAHNNLGSQIAASLANFLCATRIRILDIEAVGLGPSGFDELQEAMTDEVALVSFNISKNRGGFGAANFLMKLVLNAPELQVIDASYNFIPPESLNAICAALKQTKGKIKRLDLTGTAPYYYSTHISMFDEFQIDGKPVVIFSSPQNMIAPYDDDP